jgi:hypothetical protein
MGRGLEIIQRRPAFPVAVRGLPESVTVAEPEINLHRDMGRLEGRISSLEHQLSEHRTGMTVALGEMRADFRTAVGELKASLDEITAHIRSDDLTDAQRVGAVRGAWWVIGLVSAALIRLGRLAASILRAVLK